MTGPVNNSLVKLPTTSTLPTLPTVTPQLPTPMLGSIMTQMIAAGTVPENNGQNGLPLSDNIELPKIISQDEKFTNPDNNKEIANIQKATNSDNIEHAKMLCRYEKITNPDNIRIIKGILETKNTNNSTEIRELPKTSSLENDPHIIAISDIPRTEKQKFISFANSQYQNALDEFNILCKQAETTGSRIEHKGDSVLHYDKNNTLLYESKDFQNGSKFGTIYKFSYDKDSTAVVYYEGLKRTKVEITTPKGTVTLTDFDADGEFQSVNGTMDGKTFSDINIDF